MPVSAAAYEAAFLGALRREYGPVRHATKIIARMAGVSRRAVYYWLSGERKAPGLELVRIMAESTEVEAEVMRLVAAARAER